MRDNGTAPHGLFHFYLWVTGEGNKRRPTFMRADSVTRNAAEMAVMDLDTHSLRSKASAERLRKNSIYYFYRALFFSKDRLGSSHSARLSALTRWKHTACALSSSSFPRIDRRRNEAVPASYREANKKDGYSYRHTHGQQNTPKFLLPKLKSLIFLI